MRASRRRRRMRRLLYPLVALTAVVLALVLWTNRTPAPYEDDASPDILVLLVNGLRADLPGLPSPEAAFLESLGRVPSYRFTAAYTQSTHRYLGLGSMITGQYPSAIPLCTIPRTPTSRESAGQGLTASESEGLAWCNAFGEEKQTLPRILAHYGYATMIWMGPFLQRDVHSDSLASLEDQFQESWDSPPEWGMSADALDAPLLEWWDSKPGQPRFAVVAADLRSLSADPMLTELTRVDRAYANGLLGDTLTQEEYAQAAGFRDQLYAAYTQAASSSGARIRALLQLLESHRGDRPLVVYVTSTGGLSLGETSGTPSLPQLPVFQEILLERTTHVPMLIFEMDQRNVRMQEGTHPVEVLDITPTVLARAGATPLVEAVGNDLVAEVSDPPEQSAAYTEFGDMLSVRVGDYFMMARMWMHGGTSLNPEITERLLEGRLPQASFTLHEVLSDPLQEQDLMAAESDTAEHLKAVLMGIREGPGAVNLGDFSVDEVDMLMQQRTDGYW